MVEYLKKVGLAATLKSSTTLYRICRLASLESLQFYTTVIPSSVPEYIFRPKYWNHRFMNAEMALIRSSDILLTFLNISPKVGIPYTLWVNSTNLDRFYPLPGENRFPGLSCPSKRLASTVYPRHPSGVFYLYHQVDGTTVTEHIFDRARNWVSHENITVKLD